MVPERWTHLEHLHTLQAHGNPACIGAAALPPPMGNDTALCNYKFEVYKASPWRPHVGVREAPAYPRGPKKALQQNTH